MSLDFLSLRISDGSKWTELNDHMRYVVEGSTFAETQTTYRRITTESPYIAGRFLINAIPDVIEESIVLYVYGQDQVDLNDNLDRVIKLFTQFSYILEFTLDSSRTQYQCEPADYSINKTREFIHNTMAQINLRIPRTPETERSVDF